MYELEFNFMEDDYYKGTKELPINKGDLSALVDEDVYEIAKNYNWKFLPVKSERTFGYAFIDYIIPNWGWKRIFLHQFVMGYALNGKVIDHIDGFGLNNKRDNLRYATHAQNMQNKIIGNTKLFEKVIGMDEYVICDPYTARLKIKGEYQQLGDFMSWQEAVMAYNDKAKEIYGEFAKLLVPEYIEKFFSNSTFREQELRKDKVFKERKKLIDAEHNVDWNIINSQDVLKSIIAKK